MPPAWTISGQTGKTLDATSRPASDVDLQGGVLALNSLDVDTLTWRQVRGIVPDYLQTISLFRDGTRVFQGTITQRKYVWQPGGGSGYTMSASGGLYLMSIGQIMDDATGGTSRPTFMFPPGDLRAMILRLLASCPGITAGDIDTMFPVGRQTFSGGTWMSTLLDLLKPVADVAGWVDYSGTGVPRLCIGRRGTMDVLSLTVGTDPIASIELAPRSELQVTGISLASASRDASGATVYATQTSGDASHLIAVSGPEVGAFVPPDNLPVACIQTTALYSLPIAQYLALDSTMFAAAQAAEALGAVYGFGGGVYGIPVSGLAVGTGNYKIVAGQMVDFLKTDYGWVESTVRVTGWLGWWYNPTNGYGSAVQALINAHKGMMYSTGVSAAFSLYYDVQIPVVNVSCPAATTIYAKAAYEYLTPPAGMAAGMLAAANFIPYEGNVALNPGYAWTRFIGRRLNVANADTDLASAGALIQSAAVTLASGAVVLRCGAPLRVSLNSIVSRYSSSTKDNIALL